ncbi:MAG: IS630 family transposase [Afipia sp.]|nr:IS630 family transposase [Afipia sp.]MCR6732812.1 IS630 family transposase [Afipia sp.]MCR6733577.1 IS630 family transposase [Afipia sp.]MCR6735645.1 IS630 family transposase [Afipia sp.]
MSIPVSLRGDFTASQLRALARKTKDGPQARRLLALAAIYDGATRTEAARIGGVTLQIIRDWVMRFNARGAAGLLDGKSPGQPSRLNDVQRQAIVRMIESGPIPAIHGVVRWRLIDLSQWIYEEFRITVAKQTLSRELRAMGYRKLSARPRHHAQAEGAIEDFKKKFPARLDEVARENAIDVGKIEIWFQDEARIGQKNKITRRWAKRGTRPSAPQDQRTASTYIFGAICPKQGKGAALILPSCNIEAMNLHLAEIAKAVAPGAHAVLLVDQAGWHLSARLLIPANITILALPPKCPELNPVENIWQYMRDNWLSNRVFKSYDDIVDHCCYAWNTLVDRPWKIMSIGLRQWAHGF